jgi:hypothetical protein
LFRFHTKQTNALTPLPPIKIGALVKSKIGKHVGDYCTYLFEQAYKSAGIAYVRYALGTKVDYTKGCVFAGDIITLGNMELSRKRNDSIVSYVFTIPTQYFIYKVKGEFMMRIRK